MLILILLLSGCIENNQNKNINSEPKEPYYNPATIIVGKNTNSNFTTIQDAINNASDGNTILVEPGVYQETIKVNKSVNLIGEDLNNTIILSENSTETAEGKIFHEEKTRINILTIVADNCLIKNFTFKTNDKNKIIRGIILDLPNNTIMNCNISGLYNAIEINQYSKNNTICQNIISNNNVGIDATDSNGNLITDNFISNNSQQGVYFYTGSDNNVFSKNIFTNNYQALRIKMSSGNQIYENYFYKNVYGVYFCCSARGNWVYNNTFIQNTKSSAHEDKSLWNHWNADTGPYGNYWDDYDGVDEDGDGIGDTNYIITSSERTDFYPLMNPVDVDYYFKNKIT